MSPYLAKLDAARIAAALRPHLGRSVDTALPVKVYRNLHNRGGRWSIQQRGRVVAHADAIMLRDVRFVVSEAGAARSRRLGHKVVCAFAVGILTGSGMGIEALGGKPLPARVEYDTGAVRFVCRNLTGKAVPVDGASVALFRECCTAAYTHGAS